MKALRITLGLLAGLFFVTAASAAEARGRIIQINAEKTELQLEARGPWRGSVLDLTLGPKTQIFIGGQPGTLSDLAPGRRVRVVFEQRDGKSIARVIRSFGVRAAVTQSVPAAAPPKEGDGVTGTLQRVALTDREVVVIGPGAKGPRTETTIAVPEKTPITRDGKDIAFEALKEGETVTVKTQSRKGQLSALSIRVGQAAATASAPPPRRALIPRLRQALKLADDLLRQMENRP
jgi:hypothetical protein